MLHGSLLRFEESDILRHISESASCWTLSLMYNATCQLDSKQALSTKVEQLQHELYIPTTSCRLWSGRQQACTVKFLVLLCKLTWVARLAVATQLQLLAPLQNVFALCQRLDVVEPAECQENLRRKTWDIMSLLHRREARPVQRRMRPALHNTPAHTS